MQVYIRTYYTLQLHVQSKEVIQYDKRQFFMLPQEKQERSAAMAMLNPNKEMFVKKQTCIIINRQYVFASLFAYRKFFIGKSLPIFANKTIMLIHLSPLASPDPSIQ